jgi:hypothetical protein
LLPLSEDAIPGPQPEDENIVPEAVVTKTRAASVDAGSSVTETLAPVSEAIVRRAPATVVSSESVVYAVPMPASASSALAADRPLAKGTRTQGGDSSPTVMAGNEPVDRSASEPQPSAQVSSSGGIEPSAISIPQLDIAHPTCPHVVVLIDYQPRRSRPASLPVPPEQKPVVIHLTSEAHAFGKVVKAFSLAFDKAASSLHGFFQVREDGGYSLHDESTNGTKLNGQYVEKGALIPLKDCDVITLGAWTKMVYFEGSPAADEAVAATEEAASLSLAESDTAVDVPSMQS